jgi:hypothetical protein
LTAKGSPIRALSVLIAVRFGQCYRLRFPIGHSDGGNTSMRIPRATHLDWVLRIGVWER